MLRSLFLCLLSIFIFCLVSIHAETIYVAGDVSGTWSADTVIVTNEIRIPPGATLTIQPGVEVLFFAYFKFIVDQATLIAVGTENDSIRFDEYSPGGNNWKGIRFLYASASSRLEYCHLTNGWASGGGEDSKGGAIYCDNSSPAIQNCLIDNCSADDKGGGVYCTVSNPTISGNTISVNHANNSGGGIYCSGSNPTISGNTIIGNYGWNGGGIYCNSSSPDIIGNTISGNIAGPGGGIYCNGSSPTISGNTIIGNWCDTDGGGIYCYSNSNPTIIGNTISGNISIYSGGGISCNGSSPTISGNTINGNSVTASWYPQGGGINCEGGSSPTISGNTIGGNSTSGNGGGIYCENNLTIVSNRINGNTAGNGGGIFFAVQPDSFAFNEISDNTASGNGGGIYLSNVNQTLNKNTIVYNTAASGGGIYCDNSSPPVINCILWGNTPQQIAQGAGSNTQITYTDIGQFWPGLGNINADPLFYATTGDSAYYLTENSPCIDTGNPDPQYNDPDSTRADMGCYYFDQFGAPTNELSGNLNGTLTAGEYHVVGEISVDSGDSLIIEPGTIIFFDGDYQFYITGYLHAVGTGTDSICFMPNHPDSTWQGIAFQGGGDNNIMQYCLITGANKDGPGYHGGGLLIYTARPTISNCTITGNHATGSGGGIYVWWDEPIIHDCVISENTADASGGGIYIEHSYMTMENCRFEANSSPMGGGAFTYNMCYPTFRNCTFTGSSTGNGAAVYMYNFSSPTIENCTFSGISTDGVGAITADFAAPTLVNCIIEGSDCNGAINYINGGGGNVNYCDFFNNLVGNFVGVPPANLGTITTTNANGDSCDVYHNIFLDPLFSTDPDSLYRLTENSPCIDAGDPASPLDPDSTVADMGAYYYHQDDQVQVSGYCYLEGQIDHSGTKVLFQEDSPTAVTDSTYTNASGYYQIGIESGAYDVYFSHEGYIDSEMLDQMCFSNIVLTEITLIQMIGIPIYGPLSGILEQNTYNVIDDISVQDGDSLIIDPGSIFLFNSNSSFSISGYLYAVGTVEDSIKFIPTLPGSTWEGISFLGSTSDNRLGYCIITESNSNGIYCPNTNMIISHCKISDNNSNGIYCYFSNPTISHCIISHNTTEFGWGGGIRLDHAGPTINNCTISTNYATNGGGGIYCYHSNPVILNTVIEGNDRSGGLMFNNSLSSIINYCNFYNNGGGNFAGELPTYLGQIVTTNANGDSCDLFYNIFENPLFEDPANRNYQITWVNYPISDSTKSPCIDAGDPNSPLDPDNTVADMGAYYFCQDVPDYLNSVQISGVLETTSDITLNDNALAALDSNAIDGYDPLLDVPKPAPPPNDYLTIYFPHPEWISVFGDNFGTDVRNANDDLTNAVKIYDFAVDTDHEGEVVDLIFTIWNEYPGNYGVVLFNPGDSVYQNIREENLYTFTSGAVPTDLSLRLGDGSPPVTTFIFPVADTTLNVLTEYLLEWNFSDVSPVRYSKLYFSYDDGINYTFIDSLPGNEESCFWTTPDSGSDSVRIKIEAEDWAGNLSSTESDRFGISLGEPPQIEIAFPSADTLLYADSLYAIEWTTTPSNPLEYTLLFYSLDDGTHWTQIDSLPAGTDDTYDWTIPDTFSVYAKIKILAVDIVGNIGTSVTAYTFNIAPNFLEKQFEPPWQMFSIPLTPEDSGIDSILGDDITGTYFVFDYSQTADGYFLVNTLESGKGYWLAFMNSSLIDIAGEPEVDSAHTDLGIGWNMVGNGIPTPISLDSLCFSDGDSIVSYTNAANYGWIVPDVYSYNGSINDYEAADTLEIWNGYWLKALASGLQMMTFPPYPDTSVSDELFQIVRENENTNRGWQVQIALSIGDVSSSLTVFGTHPQATDEYDIWHDAVVPPLPPGGDYIRAVFGHPEWNSPAGVNFCRDIRAPFIDANDFPQMKQWNFLLSSSDSGEVTLDFSDLTGHLPEGYSAVAIYGQTAVNLMAEHAFSLNYNTPLNIEVKVFNCAATLLGWNIDAMNMGLPTEFSIAKVYPNPFNPRTTIRIGLPEAADLNLTIYNILGQRIVELSDGLKPAGYHNFIFEGDNLSSGIYFIRAHVPGKMNQMRKIVLVK